MLRKIKKLIQQRKEEKRKADLKKKFVGKLRVGKDYGVKRNTRPPFR